MDTSLCISSSPSTLLSSLTPTKPNPIPRRDFLGCISHNNLIRPPTTTTTNYKTRLRSRKKCQSGTSFIFCVKAAASLDTNAVVFMVAVAAVSAVSIVLVGPTTKNNNKKKKKKTSIEAAVSLNLLLSQLAKYLLSRIFDLQKLLFGDLQKLSSLKGTQDAENKPEVNVNIGLDEDCKTYQAIDFTHNDCELPVLTDSVSVRPSMFATEMSEMQLENSDRAVEAISNAVLVTTTTNGSTLVNENNKVKLERDYATLEQPVRQDLCTTHGTNKSISKSPLSPYASNLIYNAFSIKRKAEQKKVNVAAKDSKPTADCLEVKVPRVSPSGPSSKRKDPVRGKRSLKDKEKGQEAPDKRRNLSGNNTSQVKEKHPLPEVENSYNRLLKDGRLTECVEYLEDLDKKGLLEMNKIYHAKFFQFCKVRKALKEAYRFTKLIPNPTLSTFNMLMSVCANCQDSEGGFKVVKLLRECGLKPDCKLYTTLISACAKSGKVDAMFEVFHEMVRAGVEPNNHTYGALIDGCARAGQVAKAFGAYGIMRSKNVKPDRVVFNALITACGQAGAVDRAFDVLSEMRGEIHPIDPDHVTVGSLIKACAKSGQMDRAKEVYKMIHEYDIKGTPEVYTIALNCCSETRDWDFACSIYGDMLDNEVIPDQMFLSALVDVAGHVGKLDAAFEIVQEARKGINLGIVPYSSLMGACCNAKNWEKALELYEDIKSIKLSPTVSTMNALITTLCNGDQLQKAMEVLSEMKRFDLCPNSITYCVLMVASEKNNDLEAGLKLFSEAKEDGLMPNLTMCKCLISMCFRRFVKASTLGEPVLSFSSGMPQIDNNWTSVALMAYRETIAAGVLPTVEVFSLVLACLKIPHDASLKTRLVENLGVSVDTSKHSNNLCSLVDGFGEYDPRAFSLLEEASSLGIVPGVSFKGSPIVVDARKLQVHTAEVYILTILKGLKHRLAAGTKLPNITILLPIEKTEIQSLNGEKSINLSGRLSQGVAALLRRLGLSYQGSESYGKILINGLSLKRWLVPKLPASPFPQLRLGQGIIHQQRDIRTGNLSL
ncbi:hypothetical protein ACFE04_013142 [Oxalis oulophora]